MKPFNIEPAGVFYDNERFPIGFRRCGDFTISEADLLHTYGKSLRALETGARAPSTADEKKFVAVLLGERPPESELERAWIKYRVLSGRSRNISAFGKSKADRSPDFSDYSDDSDDM